MRTTLTLALVASLAAGAIVPPAAIAQARYAEEPIAGDEASSELSDSVTMRGQGRPDAVRDEDDRRVASQMGDAFYCGERKLGTWFYCEKPKPNPSDRKAAQPAQSAAEQLAAIGKELDEKKARAILDPTPENVSSYISYQRQQLNRASSFADMWRRSIWQNPELDYTLQRPVNQLGKRTWLDTRTADKNRVLGSISKRYGVFYFYSSACAACEVFGPIMRSVSDRFGLTVMAVSLDGGPSKTFPNFTVDTGQYRAMGMQGGQVPALVLFDTVTKRPMPIGYGVMAADEVMDRIFTLTSVEPGSDF
ncbi:conjugal transfer protein TraF [Sphingomonas sp. Leaf257]|jgi:conjugal transfer pilus assembly protein TraF|nr:conjugal transfer protein TraF [Sphingomonas sp. Leaf257]KQO56825.1 conjugal transfer protein TraF [Sphingomonas sp. Leaf257]